MLKRGLSLLALMATIFALSVPWATSQQEGEQIPAYNAGPPAKGKKLPPIIGPDQLWGPNAQSPFQIKGYVLASKIPVVLHQQPCYCYCDRMGHNSLHSCFENTHGAQCATCLKEVFYAYSMHQKGKTAAQIRKGIIAGEWKPVDLQTAPAVN